MSEFEQFGGPQKPQQYVPVQTSGKATASLILGLLSFCLSVLTGLPAVILGMMALGEINRSRVGWVVAAAARAGRVQEGRSLPNQVASGKASDAPPAQRGRITAQREHAGLVGRRWR